MSGVKNERFLGLEKLRKEVEKLELKIKKIKLESELKQLTKHEEDAF